MDERVASAIAHWAPRFTANGVTPADFARVTASVETWPEWCAAWVAVGEQHEALGREALAEGRLRSGGEHLAQAAAYYHFAKFVFVEDLDQMKAAHARAVAAYTDALPHLDPPGRRVEIPFETGTLVAVVRTPYGEGPFPVVLMIPGLDSTKEEIRSTEQTFLDRGLATFSVDGPGQGEAEYDVKIRGDWGPVAEVLYDAIGRQSDLDRDRLGVWGVSLGGYYSVRVMAALGDRATAGVALAGPFNFGECWDGPALADPRHVPRAVGNGVRRGGSRRRGHARPLAGGRRRRRPDAAGLRPEGPADPLPAGREGACGRAGQRAADARGGQPRLRRLLALAPAAYGRLAGPPSRR